jgi:hypothetical protein
MVERPFEEAGEEGAAYVWCSGVYGQCYGACGIDEKHGWVGQLKS